MQASALAMALLVIGFNNCAQPALTDADLLKGDAGELVVPPGGGPPAVVDPATKFASLAGVYSGGLGTQVALPDGEYWTFGGYGILRSRGGSITAADAGQISGVYTGGTTTTTAALAGPYVSEVSLLGGRYAANSKTPAVLQPGEFWGNSQDGDTPYLLFARDGTISGRSANQSCSFSGKIEPHPSGTSVLKLTIRKSNCLGNGRSDTYYGVAIQFGATIHAVGMTADKTKAWSWEGYFLRAAP